MGKIRSIATFALLFLFASQAGAVGLGDIQVESRLNQRLRAFIPVVIDRESDPEDLAVKLADRLQFERAGMKRDLKVLGLYFKPRRIGPDQMVIDVQTREPVREPMLQFIVDVEHKGSRTLREYTTMLDAPDY